MFLGKYHHSIDKKGRVILPAQFRSELDEKYIDKFVITRGFDDCLNVYPSTEWKVFAERLKALPDSDDKTRFLKRAFFSNATESAIDKQGRLFIPGELRQEVSISKDVMIVGGSGVIEIWAKEKWEGYNKNHGGQSFSEVAQKLHDLGIMK